MNSSAIACSPARQNRLILPRQSQQKCQLFIAFEATTPGEFKRMGAGLEISYGFDYTPFGQCLVAVTERGICHLGFVDKDNRAEAFNHLQQIWREATLYLRVLSVELTRRPYDCCYFRS